MIPSVTFRFIVFPPDLFPPIALGFSLDVSLISVFLDFRATDPLSDPKTRLYRSKKSTSLLDKPSFTSDVFYRTRPN